MKNIEKIMKKYGRQITAVTEKGTGIKSFKCFVQPLRYKNKMYLEGTPTDIGINDSGYYLLLAPPDINLDTLGNTGYLTDGEKNFGVDRWEKIHKGEQVWFVWAVLKEQQEGQYPVYHCFKERS